MTKDSTKDLSDRKMLDLILACVVGLEASLRQREIEERQMLKDILALFAGTTEDMREIKEGMARNC